VCVCRDVCVCVCPCVCVYASLRQSLISSVPLACHVCPLCRISSRRTHLKWDRILHPAVWGRCCSDVNDQHLLVGSLLSLYAAHALKRVCILISSVVLVSVYLSALDDHQLPAPKQQSQSGRPTQMIGESDESSALLNPRQTFSESKSEEVRRAGHCAANQTLPCASLLHSNADQRLCVCCVCV